MNYYLGNDPGSWHTGVPTFARVRYRNVYPGVDLIYYGTQHELEYDFHVAPGADPGAILLSFDVAGALTLDHDGNLVVCLGDGVLVHRVPSAYQEIGGVRRPVAGRFALRGGTAVGFEIGAYDVSEPLIIDPVVLSYSTYLGGSASDGARAVAVDATGNVYLTGWAWSRDFPTRNALQPSKPDPENVYCGVIPYPPPHCYSNCPFSPCQDSFVSKIAADGASLIYSTYLGGTADDRAMAIAVDAQGNTYVTGTTNSNDFPTLNPFPDLAGGDVFITELDPSGGLVFSTHWGTGSYSVGEDIAVDTAGKVFIAGTTSAWSLPAAPSGFWRSRSTSTGGMCELGSPWVHECTVGFVAKLDISGPTTAYDTFVGGTLIDDQATGLAIDAAGNAYVATPVSGLLSKVNATGSALVYQISVPASAVAVDAAGSAYVTGAAGSSLVTTSGAFDRTCGSNGSGQDAFVTKIAPDGGSYLYSTFLGGSGTDSGDAIAVDAGGHAIVVGTTTSTDFPMTPGAFDTTCGTDALCNAAGITVYSDVFVAKLGANGQSLGFSTYLGGSGFEVAGGLAIAPGGTVWVAGSTTSSDFPTASPLQPARLGDQDAFVAKLTESGCQFEYSTTVPASTPISTPVMFASTLQASGCAGNASFEWDFGDGSPHAFQEDAVHSFGESGTFTWIFSVTFQGVTRSVSGVIKAGCRIACTASVPGAGRIGVALPFKVDPVLADCLGAASFTWDFGDGSPVSHDQNPSHAYAAAAAYPWSVTVTADGVTCSRNGTTRIFAPPTIFVDGFETGLDAWAVTPATGAAWGSSAQRSFEGAKSAWCAAGGSSPAPAGGPYKAGMDTRMVFGPFSLADTTVGRAVFAYWTKNGWDYLSWGVSTDGQNFTWTNLESGDSGGWKVKQIDLAALSGPVVIGQPAVWFGFRFTSDGSWQDEGSYVDDVRIEALAPECLVSCSATVPADGQALVPVSFMGAASTDSCNPYWPSYSWDFGDGTPVSSQSSPTHTYTAAGTYPWTLTASSGTTSCTRTGTITIAAPPPCTVTCDATVPASGYAGWPVTLQGSATASYCSGALGYSWTFGDSTAGSDVQSPAHTYATPGSFPWRLTANAGGVSCVKEGSIVVQQPPPCSLPCSATVPASAGSGQGVPFAATATPSFCIGTVSFRWAFGDGSAQATDQNPTHGFASGGTYGWTMLAAVDDQSCVQRGTITVAPLVTQTILDEGFEGAFPGSWVVTPETGTHWGPSTYRVSAGSTSAYCAGGGSPVAPPGGPYFARMSTGLLYGPFSLEGATAAKATFSYWLQTEQSFDWFSWGVSVDGQNFSGARTSGTADWQTRELDVGNVGGLATLGKPQVWLLFSFTSDSSVQKEGVYLDAVRIEKTTPEASACTVQCTATAPDAVKVGVPASFQATAAATGCSGSASYNWSFGDGATAAQQNPVHTYAAAGTQLWQVTATVGGSTCGKSGVVDAVMPPIVPVKRHLRR